MMLHGVLKSVSLAEQGAAVGGGQAYSFILTFAQLAKPYQ